MKNVVVMYNHNMSAAFLDNQHLKGLMAPNFDSCDVWKEPARAGRITESFQSEDGALQFHHFKRKFPNYPRDSAVGEDALEYWVTKLEAELKAKGEKIDALVLPFGAEERESTLDFIHDWKARQPDLKVMVTNAYVAETEPSSLRYRFAIANREDAKISNALTRKIIKPSDADYTLAPGIDLITANLGLGKDDREANALRELIGAPLLEKSRGRG